MSRRQAVFVLLTLFGLTRGVLADTPAAPAQDPEQEFSPGVQVQVDVLVARVACSRLGEARPELQREWTKVNAREGSASLFPIKDQERYVRCLRALCEAKLARVLGEPRLVTLSGRTATFLSGGDFPVPAANSKSGYRYEHVGTSLTILPLVRKDGKILLEVEPEISELDFAHTAPVARTGERVPGRSVQRVRTSFEVNNEETVALVTPGVYVANPTKPWFKLLEMLPWTKTTPETEVLVVLVTPHVIAPISPDALPSPSAGKQVLTPDDFEPYQDGGNTSGGSIKADQRPLEARQPPGSTRRSDNR